MKSDFFIVLMLIPGPRDPGNDIDVYLAPLIYELKDLWEVGTTTYDSSKKRRVPVARCYSFDHQ
jgi:Transposase family tnp2